MAEKKDVIANPRPEYYEMLTDWELCRDLMEGTRAMWNAATRWLPQWAPVEDDLAYTNRLKETILFNGYARAVRSLTGKVFKDPIIVSEETPDIVSKDWFKNVDMTGRDLPTFLRACFEDALQTGLTHILVDRPRIQAQNRGEEIYLGIRPYWVHIPAENLIWWYSEVVGGIQRLSEVRILEVATEPHGWGLKTRKRVRRLMVGEFELWEEVDTKEGTNWVMVDSGMTGLDYIPLVTVYFDRTKVMEAHPPLLDLAHLNLAHWRSQSLQTHVLSLGRRPLPYFHGYDPEKVKRVAVGPHSALINEKSDADVGFAEITGASAEAGRNNLMDLKDEMAVMSVELLVKRPGEKTATQTEIQTDESNSELGAMAVALAQGSTRATEMMMEMGSVVGGSTTTIPTDFELDSATQEEVKDFISMRTATPPLISRQRFFIELNRREVFDEDFDMEEELDLLDLEQESIAEAVPVPEEEEEEIEE
jgi:hypothetical protein